MSGSIIDNENELENRLRKMPEMAEKSGIYADEKLKYRILRAAEQPEKQQRRTPLMRVLAVACAAVIVLGAAATALPQLSRGSGPVEVEEALLDTYALGEDSIAAEEGTARAYDMPGGSFTVKQSGNTAYRSLWAAMDGANFPLIGVNGRYYRMLNDTAAVGSGMLGDAIGTVNVYTSEPALAGTNGVCSNVVAEGETVYAVKGMSGAAAAAKVNGSYRLFQRVSFGNSALIGSEGFGNTLPVKNVKRLELTGVGTLEGEKAQQMMTQLADKAVYLRAASSETNQALLIEYQSGVTLQLAVNGERLLGCGTWACPEFFAAFAEALQ